MEKMPAFQDDKGKVGLPDRTYKDKMTLFSGKEAVDLYYFGPAHTNGDTFVVFRNARVMHSGDAFARKIPAVHRRNNGGSGVAYGETIGKAAAGIKNIDKVITGHGDVMGWQDFVDFGEFNRLFLAHAKASLAAGKTPEQALAEFKLPEKFTGYDLTARGGPANNLTIIYGEALRDRTCRNCVAAQPGGGSWPRSRCSQVPGRCWPRKSPTRRRQTARGRARQRADRRRRAARRAGVGQRRGDRVRRSPPDPARRILDADAAHALSRALRRRCSVSRGRHAGRSTRS